MFRVFINKKVSCIIVASCVMLFCVLPVLASDWLSYQTPAQWQTSGEQAETHKMASRSGSLQSARALMHADIKNNTGEKIGSVKELILDDTRDVVRYVVIESNGTFHPVPWSAFDITSDSIMLNIDKRRFMDSPQTSTNYLDKLSSPDFRKDIRSFYSEQISAMHVGMKEGMKPTSGTTEKPVLRVYSDVIGLKVQNIQGENLADMKNLIIDTHQGKIAYGLVGFGGFLGVGEMTAAVPWTSLAVQPSGNVIYLDADRATLEASVVEEKNLDMLSQPQFARDIHENFGAKPYWEVLGFVPPGEKPISMAAWETVSKYNAFFNQESMTTIDGTIRSIGIFTPEWGATAGLKLTVETSGGELVIVHGGPEQYTAQREMNFKAGSPITVTGSKTQIGSESVIMACEIKAGDKSLLLRDNQGQPKWDVDQMEREYQQRNETQQDQQLQEWE